MYPLSYVEVIEYALSDPAFPKVLNQIILPSESSFIVKMSQFPAPKEFVQPATTYVPSLDAVIDEAQSFWTPPKVLSYILLPLTSSLSIQTFILPAS